MNFDFGPLDLLLITGVSLLVTIVAFVRRPRVKAFVFSIPLPFTLATLALASPIEATHAAGVLNLLLFLNLVRWLHVSRSLHIVASTILAASVYIGLGVLLNRIIPDTDAAFVICTAITLAVSGTAALSMPARREPHHRSDLPIPVKFVAVAGVVTIIVILKNALGGFMTTFPLSGVVTVYETRRSLWTLCRHAAVMVLSISAMIVTMRVLQQIAGMSVGMSLIPGWVAWLSIMIPVTAARWRREDRSETGTRPELER